MIFTRPDGRPAVVEVFGGRTVFREKEITVDGIYGVNPYRGPSNNHSQTVRLMFEMIDDDLDCPCGDPDCWATGSPAFTRRPRDEWPDHAVW
jgi:hypothetical protein